MGSFIDVNKVIERAIQDFPNNPEFQKKLGLDPRPAYKSLSDVPWEEKRLMDWTRQTIQTPLRQDIKFDKEKVLAVEDKYMKISNRILMMQLFLKSGYCPPEIEDPELLKIYIDIAVPEQWQELKAVMEEYIDLAAEQINCPQLREMLRQTRV